MITMHTQDGGSPKKTHAPGIHIVTTTQTDSHENQPNGKLPDGHYTSKNNGNNHDSVTTMGDLISVKEVQLGCFGVVNFGVAKSSQMGPVFGVHHPGAEVMRALCGSGEQFEGSGGWSLQ